jgi:SAM-dependent methyltransferase
MQPSPPATDRDHWPELARRWRLLGPPLRPQDEDVRAYQAVIDGRPAGSRPPRVLLLGVTPEIYRLRWPEGTDFQAADRARAMIEAVWPGPREAARCEDWTALRLPDASRDVVLCDGGLHLLSYPEGQAALVRSLRRVLAPGGLCLLRLFVPPREPEPPSRVLADLRAGRIPDSNLLKLRLGMSLQREAGEGVRLADVWDAFAEGEADPEALATRAGWAPDEVRAIEAYRGSESRYHFVTVAEAKQLFCRAPGGFEAIALREPSYPLGERCPLLVLRRAPDADRGGVSRTRAGAAARSPAGV